MLFTFSLRRAGSEAARILACKSRPDVGGGDGTANPDASDAVGVSNHIRDCDEGDGMQLVMAPHYFRPEPMTMYICRPDQSAATVSAPQTLGAAL